MENRIKFINTFIIIVILGLILRFVYLQIIKYSFYSNLAKKNAIRTIQIGIPRGEIFDRNSRVLAKDHADFNLVFSPYNIKNPQREAKILSPIIGMKDSDLVKILSQTTENPFYRKILKLNISKAEMSKIEEYAYYLPGIYIQLGINRDYPLGKASAQLLGYTGEVSQQQLDQMAGQGLKPGDYIGQYGLEEEYNQYLMGKPEGYEVEVNALGQQIQVLHKTKIIPGDNLYLTVDKSLQKICYNALKGWKEGAIVAMNPNNGQILALVSKPAFNPDDIAKYLQPPYSNGNPFLDRVISGQFPPASIFKIITATAGLEDGYIGEHDKINCPATIKIGNSIFHNWDPINLGWIDIDTAFPISNDIFFAKLGLRIGIKNLLGWAKLFGVGSPTGIDLPGEASGHIPSNNYGPERENVNISIGQGSILMTPLQIARELSIVANGGQVWQPYIVKKIVSPDGRNIQRFYPVLQRTVFRSNRTLEILRRDLTNVVAWPNGTGYSAYVPGLQIAGKTGTAETGPRHLNLPLRGAFACFTPVNHPSIVLVVYLDYAPSSWFAAGIAGKILKEYFLPSIANSQNTNSETKIKQLEEYNPNNPYAKNTAERIIKRMKNKNLK